MHGHRGRETACGRENVPGREYRLPRPPALWNAGRGGKNREGDLRKPVLYEEIGDCRIVPSLAACIADVKRGFRTSQKLDELTETWITAGIPATADSYPFDIPLLHLEICKGFISNRLEILEPGVFFPDPPGAVVTPFLERQAVPAPQRLNSFYFFKITVFAETATINPRTSPDVNGQLGHVY